jgi:DNA (cytosine-5)-methyltransferase 1
MRLLDLFCGAGGCTAGYQRAGFWVRGVDLKRQPRYVGEQFVQADALEYLQGLIESGEIGEFDAVHASPPCQAYSISQHIHANGSSHPDLIAPCRALLMQSGLPWVMENVVGAPLRMPIVLCGLMFSLGVLRHRLFESPEMLLAPFHPQHPAGNLTGAGHGYSTGAQQFVCVAGNNFNRNAGARAMKIEWMTRPELAQAIPPAYTEFIGRQLVTVIENARHDAERRAA